jgi:hypothetical protein
MLANSMIALCDFIFEKSLHYAQKESILALAQSSVTTRAGPTAKGGLDTFVLLTIASKICYNCEFDYGLLPRRAGLPSLTVLPLRAVSFVLLITLALESMIVVDYVCNTCTVCWIFLPVLHCLLKL